jgi:hypothetical protein
MSEADKRSVHTDALATLGTIITGSEGRDAIHLAVIPAKCGYGKLKPGQPVQLDAAGSTAYEAYAGSEGIGIVDPFLSKPVECDQWFWLVIRPRVITSLRHVWTHPAIMDETGTSTKAAPTKEESEAWLRKFCQIADCPGYDTVIDAIKGKASSDPEFSSTLDAEYLHFNGTDAHGDIPDEFWLHVENVTGLKNLPRAKYFSCSC